MESLIAATLIVGWLLPFLIILFSERTHGGEKLAWLIAMLFISWFAWFFYMLLAPLKHNPYEEREYKDLTMPEQEYDEEKEERVSKNRTALILALVVIAVLMIVWTNYQDCRQHRCKS